MDTHDWPRCIKSARRKRRLVKTDRDKQLIKLYKRRIELKGQKSKLSLVELENPYQSGWKRLFVLHNDLKHSVDAEFYEMLLQKINTVQYHHDKSFKIKKRRKKKYGFKESNQLLREFSLYEWDNHPEVTFSEQERTFFTCVDFFNIESFHVCVKYVFNEPWRYVLKVMPNMITHQKPVDIDIERELARIENHIGNYNLAPRIHLLTTGKYYHWRNCFAEHFKYINNFKNMPRYAKKEAYLELET